LILEFLTQHFAKGKILQVRNSRINYFKDVSVKVPSSGQGAYPSLRLALPFLSFGLFMVVDIYPCEIHNYESRCRLLSLPIVQDVYPVLMP